MLYTPPSLRARIAAAAALALCGTPALLSAAQPAPTAASAVTSSEPSVPEPAGYWTGPMNGPVPATLTGGKIIHTQELAALLERERAVVVDVSNAPRKPEGLPPDTPWMPVPQRIIPGSLWIAGAGLGVIEPSIDASFRERLAVATGNDFARPVVVYCHERCWLSWNAAKRALKYGYRNVYWFPDGIEGWRAAGLPTAIAEPEQKALE
jgi:PQQ-dependent catabolism-associated CXXCW motif protein